MYGAALIYRISLIRKILKDQTGETVFPYAEQRKINGTDSRDGYILF
jgi:hypothetical protein